MIAIEATIVSTAMPQIVGQLGGLPLYSWVFLGVPFDADRHHRGVWQARRSRRPQIGDAGRDRGRLSLWLDPMRICVVDAVADRLPVGAAASARARSSRPP